MVICWLCLYTHWLRFKFKKVCFYVENQQKVGTGSKAAKKNKKRKSKKSGHRDEAAEKERVDFNYMLTELKNKLEEAKSTKVCW